MKNQQVTTNKQKLDTLFDHFKELSKLNNSQIDSQWSIYLCIRVSGFLETSLNSIYIAYCQDKAHSNISKYIQYSFEGKRSQNMKPEVILQLAGAFSPTWRSELEQYLDDERRAALESVVNIRNSAAHGGTMSVSYNNIKDYYKKIWEVIQFIDQQVSR